MGGCSLVQWFGKPVSQLPLASLRAQVAGCTVLLELMGLMHRALMAMATDKEAEQLAHHLQGNREFAPQRLVQKVVRYTFAEVKNVLKHCGSVTLVLEGDHPTKSCRHERRARRDDSYRSFKWRGAMCPSDCMIRALLMEVSHWQDTSGAELASDCDPARLRVHAAVHEADGFICHSLLHATPGTVWALVYSNDGDFAVQDKRIAEHCVYNCRVNEEDILGSVLCHDNFVRRNGVSLRDWSVVKRIACATLGGNDYYKREKIGPERAFDLIERLWQEPLQASPLDNLLRIQSALQDPAFDKDHPLKPGYNRYIAACCSAMFMLVDSGEAAENNTTIYDTMYPVAVLEPATPEQVSLHIPYQLTLDHRPWSGKGFAEIAKTYIHVGDDSCAVAQACSGPMETLQEPDFGTEPDVAGAGPAVHTTASQLYQLHQQHMKHSPMAWNIDHEGKTVHLQVGQLLSFPELDLSSAVKTAVSSLKVHCQRQGHSVRVTRSASIGKGEGKIAKITVACSHQAGSPAKRREPTEPTESPDRASAMQAADAMLAVPRHRTVLPLEARTQADLDDINRLPRRGQRQYAALAGCVLADQAVSTAQHFHGAWLRATRGGTYEDMDSKIQANYVDAVGTGMILAASRAPGAADMGVPEKVGGTDGCFSDHLHTVLSLLDEDQRGSLRTCTSFRADESSSVISSADAFTSDVVICVRRVDERRVLDVLSMSDQGRRMRTTWEDELAVNAVLLGKLRGMFVVFTVDKMTGQLGRREVIKCFDLDLERGKWAIDCIRSTRARLRALPMETFPPRHQYLKLPVQVQPPQTIKLRKASRVSSQMGHVCDPLCSISLHFFLSLTVKVELRVPGFSCRIFTVRWTHGHQHRQCNLSGHPPSSDDQQFHDDNGSVLNLSKRQRGDVRCWLLQLEASEASTGLIDSLSPLTSGDGTFLALSLDRSTTAEVKKLVENHSHPRVRIEPPDARLLPDGYEWQAAMHQARLGRPFASILAELDAKGLGGLTRKDLANLQRKTLTAEQASWVRDWTQDELRLHGSGGCSELFIQLLKDDTKFLVLSALRLCAPGRVSNASPALAKGKPSQLRLLKVPASVAAQWGDPAEKGRPYRLYSFTSSAVNKVLQRSPAKSPDTRWSVADRLFRPTPLRPKFLEPWDFEDGKDGALQITALIHTTETQMRRFIRSPHRLHIDGTFGCSTADYVNVFPLGQTADPYNLCLGSAIVRSENQEDFGFLVLEAMPLLYGRSLGKTRVVIADGSPVIQKVIRAAVDRGVLGDKLTVVRLCFFHGVVLPVVSQLLRFASSQGADHPIRLALAAASATRRHAATEMEVWSGLDTVQRHVEQAQNLHDLPSTARDKLQAWSHSVRLNAAKLFPGIAPGLLTFGVVTSGPAEAEHSAAKARGYRSGQTGLGKDKSLATGALVESQRQVLREIEFKRHDAANLAKVVSGVPASVGVQLTTAANKSLRESLQGIGSRYAFSRMAGSNTIILCEELTVADSLPGGVEITRTVELHIQDGMVRCSRELCPCWQSGFPCAHQIHLNLGRVEASDFHPIHLSSVAAGALDEEFHFAEESLEPVLIPLRVSYASIPAQVLEEGEPNPSPGPDTRDKSLSWNIQQHEPDSEASSASSRVEFPESVASHEFSVVIPATELSTVSSREVRPST